MQKIFFMAGFPRSSSTLLMNVLAQNPTFYPTPTSGLISSLINQRDSWRQNDIYKSNGEEYIYPKIKTMLKGLLYGYYEKEILNDQIPIDKNRSWTGHIDLLEEILEQKVKIIFPIRNVVDCMISMEKVNRKATVNNHGDNGNWLNEQSTIGRAENFIKDDGVFGLPLLYLREMIYRNLTDRLVFVPYLDLLVEPEETFKRIYKGLELPHFKHKFNSITQVTYEEDMEHGFAPKSLHQIRNKIEEPQPRDLTIFHEDYINDIENKRFKDITELIFNISLIKKIV